MDEADAVPAAVLRRLGRIDELRRSGAPAGTMLGELRALLAEAEEWSRAEGGDAGRDAVAHLRAALSKKVPAEVAAFAEVVPGEVLPAGAAPAGVVSAEVVSV